MVDLKEAVVRLKANRFQEGVREPLEARYEPKDWDLDFVDLHFVKPIHLEGVGERVRQTLTIRGTLTSQIEQTCNRCLNRMLNDISEPFQLTYEIQGEEGIDASDDLRELLILRRPERFLCSEQCKGICAFCGANLNLGPCGCKPHWEPESKWTPLKEGFQGKDQ